jgi:HD-like signal output (HDOD) protein
MSIFLKRDKSQDKTSEDKDLYSNPDELKVKLLSIFQDPKYKPPVLPDVALELMELSRKPDVSYQQVGQVIERDSMVLAQVLKVAQSPAYATRQAIQSVRDALNRLGINALRDIVWQVVVDMRLFRSKAYQPTMLRLRAHSMFTAHMVRHLAKEARIAGDHAFLCGLLHDIGMTGALIALHEGNPKPPPIETIMPALDTMHVEASSAMAKLWGLSQEVCNALRFHHHAPNQGHTSDAVVALITLAEGLGNQAGFGVSAETEPGPQTVDIVSQERMMQAAARLKLDTKIDGLRLVAQDIGTRIGN